MIGILIGTGEKGMKKKENTHIGLCRIYCRSFLEYPPFRAMGEAKHELPLWRYRPLDVAAAPPGLSPAAGSPIE